MVLESEKTLELRVFLLTLLYEAQVVPQALINVFASMKESLNVRFENWGTLAQMMANVEMALPQKIRFPKLQENIKAVFRGFKS